MNSESNTSLSEALKRYKDAKSKDVQHSEDWFKKIEDGPAPNKADVDLFLAKADELRTQVEEAWETYRREARNYYGR
ncbi:hypothetical protein [Burkholderia gladioli]|uniref:hypothetical protein n=1 Tax=Burkholderia gladioli TaxID=28095 RepID=UPI00163F16AA|nr:hypothetical protein [Burkholderia gladioli]